MRIFNAENEGYDDIVKTKNMNINLSPIKKQKMKVEKPSLVGDSNNSSPEERCSPQFSFQENNQAQ